MITIAWATKHGLYRARRTTHDLQGVIKRSKHVGRDVPIGELFRPIYFTHSSMEAAIINDVVLEGIMIRI
jgi:hypothetical protein